MSFQINPYLYRCYSFPGYFIREPEENKGRWKGLFENPQGLFLDIGCGSGSFIVDLARRHPGYAFIGIDYSLKYLLKAIKKARAENLSNLRFVNYHARDIEKIFSRGEVSGAYLLFSDPYRKNRQIKHRVVQKDFLKSILRVMEKNRFLIVKTDDEAYFRQIVNEIGSGEGFVIICVSEDFRDSEYRFGGIESHYEKKFEAKKIKWLVARKTGRKLSTVKR